jgi:hypothetical protein
MSGWQVRWVQGGFPNSTPLVTTVYSSKEAAVEWVDFVQRNGATHIELIEVETDPGPSGPPPSRP